MEYWLEMATLEQSTITQMISIKVYLMILKNMQRIKS